MTKANLDKQPGDVAAMFDAVAERYDLLNDVLSLGQVRLWRKVVMNVRDDVPVPAARSRTRSPGPAATARATTRRHSLSCPRDSTSLSRS